MRSTVRALAVALLACLLTLSACSRSSGGTSLKSKGGNGSSDTGTSTPSNDVTSPDYGTLKDVCGPNQTGKDLTSSDRGVTATEINVTTVSDPGFVARPGLNQELFDASTVFTKWCNDLGGINGRKIVDHQRDAALVNFKQKVLEACRGDFAMVGGGAVYDDTGQDARLKCLLPDIPGYVVSAQARGADLLVQSLPNALDNLNIGTYRYLTKKFPDVKKVGFLAGNVTTLITMGSQYEEVVKALGLSVAASTQYSALGESTWTPFAQQLKTQGVQGLVFVGEPANAAKLELAFQALGWYPQWIVLTANFYDDQFLKLANGALKNTYIALPNVPFYDAAKVPAITKYLALFQHYKPNGKVKALLGVDSTAAWLLFAQSAKKCGANLTRKCMYENAKAVTSWDGGGLIPPGNPNQNLAPTCSVTVLAEGREFKPSDQTLNKGVFHCDPADRLSLKGDYGKGATLASVGKSLSDLK